MIKLEYTVTEKETGNIEVKREVIEDKASDNEKASSIMLINTFAEMLTKIMKKQSKKKGK